jgi:hypothetical protein
MIIFFNFLFFLAEKLGWPEKEKGSKKREKKKRKKLFPVYNVMDILENKFLKMFFNTYS